MEMENQEKKMMSIVNEDGSGQPKLLGVDDENEWNRIKDVLRELSKDE